MNQIPNIEEVSTKNITELAKEYASQSYLVSEESHPEEDEVTALNNLVKYHHQQLQNAYQEGFIEASTNAIALLKDMQETYEAREGMLKDAIKQYDK